MSPVNLPFLFTSSMGTVDITSSSKAPYDTHVTHCRLAPGKLHVRSEHYTWLPYWCQLDHFMAASKHPSCFHNSSVTLRSNIINWREVNFSRFYRFRRDTKWCYNRPCTSAAPPAPSHVMGSLSRFVSFGQTLRATFWLTVVIESRLQQAETMLSEFMESQQRKR